jgi:hypothetical protein
MMCINERPICDHLLLMKEQIIHVVFGVDHIVAEAIAVN